MIPTSVKYHSVQNKPLNMKMEDFRELWRLSRLNTFMVFIYSVLRKLLEPFTSTSTCTCPLVHVFLFSLSWCWTVSFLTSSLPLPLPYVYIVLSPYFKRLWSPWIDSEEWIPPAYVAWRARTITLFLLGFLVPIDCLKIPALFVSLPQLSLFLFSPGEVSKFVRGGGTAPR